MDGGIHMHVEKINIPKVLVVKYYGYGRHNFV